MQSRNRLKAELRTQSHFRDREQIYHIRGGGKTPKKFAVEGTANTVWAMKRGLQILGAVAVLALGAFLAMRAWRAGEDPTKVTGDAKNIPEKKEHEKLLREANPLVAPARVTGSAGVVPLSPDKWERIAKIRRDYDEIRVKMSADYAAVGDKFPGGLSAFLKQLALLEREMHADFARDLTPRELEDYELHQSTTGQTLQRRLAGVGVTDEQQRAVYRLQREFDDRFALVFDLSPSALWERMKVQDVLRQKIRSELSDAAFAAWLNAEDPSFGAMRGLAAEKGLPPAAGDELWRIKNEWTLRKLEIAAQQGLSPEQRNAMQAAWVGQIRSRVAVLVGADALAPGVEALAWLPVAQ